MRREDHPDYRKNVRLERHKRGLCRDCRRKRLPHSLYCERCLQRHADRKRVEYHAKPAGVCKMSGCDRPAIGCRCPEHAEVHNARRRAARAGQ